ncbi:MAG: hypothetical protein KDD64_03705 [Bdellovibrionales bacterium]|nr:hypothetical protein [Bdellovibrionales bacterium]
MLSSSTGRKNLSRLASLRAIVSCIALVAWAVLFLASGQSYGDEPKERSEERKLLTTFSNQLQQSEGLHMVGRVFNERLTTPGRVTEDKDLSLLSQIAFEVVMTPSDLLLFVWDFGENEVDLRTLSSEQTLELLDSSEQKPALHMRFDRATRTLSFSYRTEADTWTRSVQSADTPFGATDIPVDSVFYTNCWFGSLLETWVGKDAPYATSALENLIPVSKLSQNVESATLILQVCDTEEPDRDWDYKMKLVRKDGKLALLSRTSVRGDIQRTRSYDSFTSLSHEEAEKLLAEREATHSLGILIEEPPSKGEEVDTK